MEAATVDKIVALQKQIPEVVTAAGQTFLTHDLHRVMEFDPRPEAFKLSTLTGLRDYLKANVENVALDKVIVHVNDYTSVTVETAYEGETKKRTYVLGVKLDQNLKTFQFGQWMSTDDFILAARTLFHGNGAMDELVKYASLVSVEDGTTLEDNGVSTTMRIKKSVTSGVTNEVTSTGFYTLIPFRTFREIEQIESLFLFRMKIVEGKGAQVALFEADGGSWRLEAVNRIKAWITREVPTVTVIA